MAIEKKVPFCLLCWRCYGAKNVALIKKMDEENYLVNGPHLYSAFIQSA